MALPTPNRIRLKHKGQYDEAAAGGTVYPGMIIQNQSDGTVVAHAVVGGKGPFKIVEEDALQGRTINDAILVTEMVPHLTGNKSDVFLARLAAGQNVAMAAELMSAGDGTLMASGAAQLANVVADSSNVTNTTTETTFSNGTVTIPAGTLKAGDVLRIRGVAVVTGQNSTNTHQVKVKVGSTTIADSVAASLAANDVVEFDLLLTVRTIGASGTYVVSGTITAGTPGTATAKAVNASGTFDTTAAVTVTITTTASAASTGNIIKLSQLRATQDRTGGTTHSLCRATEAIDNSAGLTNAFIRVEVI